MKALKYELIKTCSITGARRGRIHTPQGTVETPAFMPVGTCASVKTLSSEDLERIGFEQILSNTYHLELRPSSKLIQNLGGLHSFMSWNKSLLTDSGGYQVMSLGNRNIISDEGVLFYSHLDGKKFFLTPEESIHIQHRLGSTICMMLDECAPYPCSKNEARIAMDRTHLWAPRNLNAKKENQNVFGIIQGGMHLDLRKESADFMTNLPFDGFAIGGVSVGEPTDLHHEIVEYTAPLMPKDKTRYLMGVGHPKDILHAVKCGIDLFDCVLPTRMARHHCLYTLQGRVNIMNKKWEDVDSLPDPYSVFPETERYSAAYLRHLFKAKETLGARLATLHNLRFYHRLMKDIRDAIEFESWDQLMNKYQYS